MAKSKFTSKQKQSNTAGKEPRNRNVSAKAGKPSISSAPGFSPMQGFNGKAKARAKGVARTSS